MLGASYGPVSDFEILWTLVCFLGFCFSLFNIRDSYCELVAVKETKLDGAMRILAEHHLIGEIIRGIILFGFLSVGITSLLVQDIKVDNVPTRIIVFGAIARWVILLAAVLLVVKSILEFIDRRRLKLVLQGEQLHEHNTD